MTGRGAGLAQGPDGQGVTAIVVSYRTGWRLPDGLHALVADPDVSAVVIVDNGNAPRESDFLDRFAQAHDTVTLLRGHGNVGFGAACNLGARAATTPWLLFVNPDAVLKRGSVAAMLTAAQGQPSPVIVGGRLFDLDGREQAGARRRELTLARALASFTGLATAAADLNINRLDEPMPDRPVAMDVISGALFLADRAGYQNVLQGFDEGYFVHVEDIDICRRAREAGGAVIFTPHAAALHYSSTSDAPRLKVEAYKAEGMIRYFRKFARGPVQRLAIAMAAPALRMAVLMRARLKGAGPHAEGDGSNQAATLSQ